MTGQSIPGGGDSGRYYLAQVSAVVVFTWLVHELAHWAVGSLLGYEMRMSLNSAGVVRGEYDVAWHGLLVTAAGPAVTILQAGVAFLLLRKTSNLAFYPFLFVAFYMRLLAGVMNVVNVNDEGRISVSMGLGTYTLPLLVSLALFVLVVRAARSEGLGLRLQAVTGLATMAVSSALVLLDQAFDFRIL